MTTNIYTTSFSLACWRKKTLLNKTEFVKKWNLNEKVVSFDYNHQKRFKGILNDNDKAELCKEQNVKPSKCPQGKKGAKGGGDCYYGRKDTTNYINI